MKRILVAAMFVSAVMLTMTLPGCGSKEDASANQPRAGTPVTAVTVTQRRVEVLERSVARLESPQAPIVAAETAGRVVEVLVDAGNEVKMGDTLAKLDGAAQGHNQEAAQANAKKLEALLENQERTVLRLEDLVNRKLAAQSTLDEAHLSARRAAGPVG